MAVGRVSAVRLRAAWAVTGNAIARAAATVSAAKRAVSARTAAALASAAAAVGSLRSTDAVWVEQRRNLATFPRATAFASFTQIGLRNTRWWGSSGAGNYALVTGASDGPDGFTTYVRKTWTTSPTIPGDTGFDIVGTSGRVAVIPGQTVSFMVWLRSSVARSFNMSNYWFDVPTGGTAVRTYLEYKAVPAGEWTLYTATVTVPAGKTYASWAIDTATVAWPVGATLDGTGLLVEFDTQGPYLDGDTNPVGGDTRTRWLGPVNASPSVLELHVPVPPATAIATAAAVSTTARTASATAPATATASGVSSTRRTTTADAALTATSAAETSTVRVSTGNAVAVATAAPAVPELPPILGLVITAPVVELNIATPALALSIDSPALTLEIT